MENVKYRIKKLFPLGKTKKQKLVPLDDQLDALEEILIKGKDENEVVRKMCEKHGRKVPKYGAQALAAPLRRIEKAVQDGDVEMIKKCEARGLLEPETGSHQRLVVNARTVPALNP